MPPEHMELLLNEVALPILPTHNRSIQTPTYSASSFKIVSASVADAGKYRCRQNTSIMSLYSSVPITLQGKT